MSNDYRVLVVDDDFHVASVHSHLVNTAPGFKALNPLSDIRRLAGAITAGAPDLVLIDLYLPQGSGLDVLAGLDIDAFVVTAANDPRSLAIALRRGALGYLVKPFKPEVLISALRDYARYRRILEKTDELDQETVRRAQRALSGESAPLGSSSGTEKLVLNVVSASAVPLTAQDVAARVGTSRATAQRHLAALAKRQEIDMELEYGARGRPEHRYFT